MDVYIFSSRLLFLRNVFLFFFFLFFDSQLIHDSLSCVHFWSTDLRDQQNSLVVPQGEGLCCFPTEEQVEGLNVILCELLVHWTEQLSNSMLWSSYERQEPAWGSDPPLSLLLFKLCLQHMIKRAWTLWILSTYFFVVLVWSCFSCSGYVCLFQ